MKDETIKAYLFDFDGTLVDSMPTFVAAMIRILDEYNIKYDIGFVKLVTPSGYRGAADYFCTLGVPRSKEEIIDMINEYVKDGYEHTIPAKEGVIETLFELKRRGVSLNVLTASEHNTLDPCLKRLGVWDLFDHVWSCVDFNTTKSDVNIYHMAAKELGRRVDEVMFVDDNINAVKTAKQAGMISCGIYDDSSMDNVDEMKACADYYVERFTQIAEL